MSTKAGGLDSCGKCKGTTDGVASRNGTSMGDAIPRDEFSCCQLYRYGSYIRRGLAGNIFSARRGDVAKLLATFAMSLACGVRWFEIPNLLKFYSDK